MKIKQSFQKIINNARQWFKHNWNNILLSDAYVYGYPIVILASISLIYHSLIVALLWGFWLYSTIVYITKGEK